MIKYYNPRPYEGFVSLPASSVVVERYELIGKTENGYAVTLARLTAAHSAAQKKYPTHSNPNMYALFESYDDHGNRLVAVTSRVPVTGSDDVFRAVKTAMEKAGTDFAPIAPCHSEALLAALGAWIQAKNPDIESYRIVSLTCH